MIFFSTVSISSFYFRFTLAETRLRKSMSLYDVLKLAKNLDDSEDREGKHSTLIREGPRYLKDGGGATVALAEHI